MLIFFLIVVLLIVGDILFEMNFPKVERMTFETEKWKSGQSFTVLQISDLHGKVFPGNNKGFLQQIREQNADIIVLTGDLIDDSTREYGPVFTFVEELLRINKKLYYISGNHEWRQAKREQIWSGLADRGVIMLNNANTQVQKGDLSFNLVGVDDPSTGHEDMETAFQGVDTKGKFTLLLAHAPDLIFHHENIPADLILSGHTHGGQVRLPLIGAIVVPGQGLFPTYDKGVFEFENNPTLYIDSGAGMSLRPIRFLCRSQITLHTIVGNKK